jgi:histidine triad (HIT) family protein
MVEDCVFCKIVRQQAPASVVYEDEQVAAFMDIRPVTQGHTLVIPKEHFTDIYSTPEELIANVHKITKRLAIAVKKAVNADGISIVQQNEKAAGQDIFHIHVHIIPRFEGRKMPRFSELKEVSREMLDADAVRIRQLL